MCFVCSFAYRKIPNLLNFGRVTVHVLSIAFCDGAGGSPWIYCFVFFPKIAQLQSLWSFLSSESLIPLGTGPKHFLLKIACIFIFNSTFLGKAVNRACHANPVYRICPKLPSANWKCVIFIVVECNYWRILTNLLHKRNKPQVNTRLP